MWASSTTPAKFELYEPRSLAPFVIGPLVLASVLFTAWTARALLLPIVTSRWIWGAASLLGVLIGTTGHMWVKIKQAPYVQATREGGINWIAGGYSNQLGLEGQIMALLYGACGFCIIVLTVFIPAQSSPFKQRVGTLLWVGFLVALFSIIIRIFRIKNGGYPFGLL
jgi:oligosaccharyltransferase complex subunit gamma